MNFSFFPGYMKETHSRHLLAVQTPFCHFSNCFGWWSYGWGGCLEQVEARKLELCFPCKKKPIFCFHVRIGRKLGGGDKWIYLTLNGLWLCWRAVWLIWPCGSSRWSGPAIVGISESGFVRISESGFCCCPPPLCNGQAPPHSCQLWTLRFPSPSPLPVCRGAHLKIKHRID